jgi:hypothetical protein
VVGACCPRLRELLLVFFPLRDFELPVFELLFAFVPPVVAGFFFAVVELCGFFASADTPSPATKTSSRAGRKTFRLIIGLVVVSY